jgi:hypothetical protein
VLSGEMQASLPSGRSRRRRGSGRVDGRLRREKRGDGEAESEGERTIDDYLIRRGSWDVVDEEVELDAVGVWQAERRRSG